MEESDLAHLILVGEETLNGTRVLDLDINRGFYEGEICEGQAVANAMAMADSVNLVGERAVGLGVEAGLVEWGNVLRIGGVPHAQAYRLG